ncbi:MAG: nuclear transport factor 2 family protein [Acidobacteriota bacterium]
MGLLRIALFVLAAAPGTAHAADQVREAETAFARAFTDRDQARFFSFVAEDATFLSPKKTMSGKAQVMQTWTQFFGGREAPFRWQPERVVINGAGDIALSTGPVFDAAGRHTGDFSSVWRKQKDGMWKVIFDGPGAPVCPAAADPK